MGKRASSGIRSRAEVDGWGETEVCAAADGVEGVGDVGDVVGEVVDAAADEDFAVGARRPRWKKTRGPTS